MPPHTQNFKVLQHQKTANFNLWDGGKGTKIKSAKKRIQFLFKEFKCHSGIYQHLRITEEQKAGSPANRKKEFKTLDRKVDVVNKSKGEFLYFFINDTYFQFGRIKANKTDHFRLLLSETISQLNR